MKTKHTPGEWVIKKSRESLTEVHISAPSWENFASVVVRMQGSEHIDPEGMANSKLIAAAPVLLSTCMAIRDAISEGIDVAKYPKAKLLIEIIDQIIRKATE